MAIAQKERYQYHDIMFVAINQIVCETRDFLVDVFCHTFSSLGYGESCEKCWSWFICAPCWFEFAPTAFIFGL
jgi:hypothetical protein